MPIHKIYKSKFKKAEASFTLLTFWARYSWNFGMDTAIFGHSMGDFCSANGENYLKFGTRAWKFSHAVPKILHCKLKSLKLN